MGGFESASMRLDTGRRVDVVKASLHDRFAYEDYRMLADAGVMTIRDAFRWHLIELSPGNYDWRQTLDQISAARRADVQVIWDLAHFGYPDWIEPWTADFWRRFADYAEQAAQIVLSETGPGALWCPINEISYWAFAGGENAHFAPMGVERGAEWKRQLVRAATAAAARLKSVDPTCKIIQPEPAIHVAAQEAQNASVAERQRHSMFEAWDMMCGVLEPKLGGKPAYLDYIGVNYYANNQWMVEGRRLGMGEIDYRPFSHILLEIGRRYQKPILITETGAEGDNARGWLRYILGEIEDARTLGVEVAGLCIYPVMDYPGWTDDRLCPCGLIEVSGETGLRQLRSTLVSLAHGQKPKDLPN